MQEDIDRLRPHLQPGETLAWAGAPDPKFFSPVVSVLVGLVIVGGVAWYLKVHVPAGFDYEHPWPISQHNGMVWLVIFTAAIVLIPPLWRLKSPPVITYGVTNRRALVLEDKLLWSYPPEAIDGVSTNKRRGGLTDVMFYDFPAGRRSGVSISVHFKSGALMHAESQHDSPSATDDAGTTKRGLSRAGFRGLRDPAEARTHLERLRASAKTA